MDKQEETGKQENGLRRYQRGGEGKQKEGFITEIWRDAPSLFILGIYRVILVKEEIEKPFNNLEIY